jgi:hypothetical protein
MQFSKNKGNRKKKQNELSERMEERKGGEHEGEMEERK